MNSGWTSEIFRRNVENSSTPRLDLSGIQPVEADRAPDVSFSHQVRQRNFQRMNLMPQMSWTSEPFKRDEEKFTSPWMDQSARAQEKNPALHVPSRHRLRPPMQQSGWASEEFKHEVDTLPVPFMDLHGKTYKEENQEQDDRVAQDEHRAQVLRRHAHWRREKLQLTLDTNPPDTNSFEVDQAPEEGPRDPSIGMTVRQQQAAVIDLRLKRQLEESESHPRWLGSLGQASRTRSLDAESHEADQTVYPRGPGRLSKLTPVVLDYKGPSLWNAMAAEEAGFSPFHYSPLSQPQEIRLLWLLPGEEFEPLHFALQHVSLDSNPEFISLSYAWGSKAKNPVTIFCNKSYIKIPENLLTALCRLRSPSKVQAVWADAACINQTDEMEKGHQVRLMRRIYKTAKKVIIWLGPDHVGLAGGAFELMKRIHQRDMQSVPPPETEAWSGITQMFQREWFWRVWCLQEVALASTAEVIWGSKTIQWEQLAFASAWIRTSPASVLRQKASTGLYNACLMYSLSNASKTETPTSFLQLLTLSRQFLASDKRDKVYGLLGLPTTDADPNKGDFFLEPDYTKTVQQVFRDCAAKIIETSGTLRILSFVQHSESSRLEDSTDQSPASEPLVKLPTSSNAFIDGLPSWVPRWYQYFAQTLCPPEHVTHQFNASINLKKSLPIIKGSSLLANGVMFSAVAEVSPTMTDASGWREYLPMATQSSLGLELLSRTITAGKNWFGTLIENEEEHLADFKAYLSSSDGSGNPSASRFEEALKTACTERKMFKTQNGFLGLGPQPMEKNDIVCVLSGAIIPVILRPRDGRFMLVGEAYVYGLMFGETVDVANQRMFEII